MHTDFLFGFLPVLGQQLSHGRTAQFGKGYRHPWLARAMAVSQRCPSGLVVLWVETNTYHKNTCLWDSFPSANLPSFENGLGERLNDRDHSDWSCEISSLQRCRGRPLSCSLPVVWVCNKP